MRLKLYILQKLSVKNQNTVEKFVPIMSDKLFNDDLIGYFAMSHWNLVI